MTYLTRMASRVAVVLVGVVLLGVAGTVSADASQTYVITGTLGSEWCGTYTPQSPSPRTFMVGDSITAQGEADLHQLRPNWEINGLHGRNVDCLPEMVADRLQQGPLDRLVIALGTNAVDGWGEADYAAVAAMVPASTAVVFVSTYRDPSLWPASNPYRRRAGVQVGYSEAMEAVAADRPHTCVADWRAFASTHPEALRDGTHPTNAGRVRWAGIVSSAAGWCGLSARGAWASYSQRR